MRFVLRLLLVPVLASCLSPRLAAGFDLLVVDLEGDQVLRFDGATGDFLELFAEIPDPRGIAADGAGLVYVSSGNGSIRQYDESGNLLDSVDTGVSIGKLAIGPDERVYAVEFFEDRVVHADFAVEPPQFLGTFVPAGSGGLDGPQGLTFGPDGDPFVTSRISGQVIRYDGETGSLAGVFATPGGNGPQGLVFGPDGDLYVANDSTDTVQRFDGTTGAALGVFADPAGNSSDGMQVRFGPDGHLYVSTTVVDDQIERFDGATGASLGVIIEAGDGGLAFPADFIAVPEPAGSAALAALALLSLRRRRR